MPITPFSNRWILVLADHFTQWQDTLPLPDVATPMVATVLEERIFCYFDILEIIHFDQGTQFESALMDWLFQLWGVVKSRTTPYRPQANGVVE